MIHAQNATRHINNTEALRQNNLGTQLDRDMLNMLTAQSDARGRHLQLSTHCGNGKEDGFTRRMEHRFDHSGRDWCSMGPQQGTREEQGYSTSIARQTIRAHRQSHVHCLQHHEQHQLPKDDARGGSTKANPRQETFRCLRQAIRNSMASRRASSARTSIWREPTARG